MLEIQPRPSSQLRQLFETRTAQEQAICLERIPGLAAFLQAETPGELGERPFVQLAYDELPEEELAQILGYAGIPIRGGPVGLPLPLEPFRLGEDARTEILFFPIDGLEAHLALIDPESYRAFGMAGSMVAFLDERQDDITAREYVVAGTLECIRHCRRGSEILVVRW